mmetsp:Transcript_10317/g.47311  ORF Transcript_10317/g.47311 Transcript_10317/m.47311 type:complete len:204 (-) Transcript_10317:1968-2579(-)
MARPEVSPRDRPRGASRRHPRPRRPRAESRSCAGATRAPPAAAATPRTSKDPARRRPTRLTTTTTTSMSRCSRPRRRSCGRARARPRSRSPPRTLRHPRPRPPRGTPPYTSPRQRTSHSPHPTRRSEPEPSRTPSTRVSTAKGGARAMRETSPPRGRWSGRSTRCAGSTSRPSPRRSAASAATTGGVTTISQEHPRGKTQLCG